MSILGHPLDRHIDPDYRDRVAVFVDGLDDIGLLSDVVDCMSDRQLDDLCLSIGARLERDTGYVPLN